jgi:hypothetical protein
MFLAKKHVFPAGIYDMTGFQRTFATDVPGFSCRIAGRPYFFTDVRAKPVFPGLKPGCMKYKKSRLT